MNILNCNNPADLLEILLNGDTETIQDFYEEIGSEEIFNKELEKEFCKPCKANQCNYCPVYVLQTKYLDVD